MRRSARLQPAFEEFRHSDYFIEVHVKAQAGVVPAASILLSDDVDGAPRLEATHAHEAAPFYEVRQMSGTSARFPRVLLIWVVMSNATARLHLPTNFKNTLHIIVYNSIAQFDLADADEDHPALRRYHLFPESTASPLSLHSLNLTSVRIDINNALIHPCRDKVSVNDVDTPCALCIHKTAVQRYMHMHLHPTTEEAILVTESSCMHLQALCKSPETWRRDDGLATVVLRQCTITHDIRIESGSGTTSLEAVKAHPLATLPETTVDTSSKILVHTVSGNVHLKQVASNKSLILSTVSGNVTCQGVAALELLQVLQVPQVPLNSFTLPNADRRHLEPAVIKLVHCHLGPLAVATGSAHIQMAKVLVKQELLVLTRSGNLAITEVTLSGTSAPALEGRPRTAAALQSDLGNISVAELPSSQTAGRESVGLRSSIQTVFSCPQGILRLSKVHCAAALVKSALAHSRHDARIAFPVTIRSSAFALLQVASSGVSVKLDRVTARVARVTVGARQHEEDRLLRPEGHRPLHQGFGDIDATIVLQSLGRARAPKSIHLETSLGKVSVRYEGWREDDLARSTVLSRDVSVVEGIPPTAFSVPIDSVDEDFSYFADRFFEIKQTGGNLKEEDVKIDLAEVPSSAFQVHGRGADLGTIKRHMSPEVKSEPMEL